MRKRHRSGTCSKNKISRRLWIPIQYLLHRCFMFFHHQLFIQRRAKRIELILPYIYNNIQKENCLSNFFFPLFFYCSLKIISETYMHTLSHPSLLLNEVLNTESRGPPKCQEERSFQSTNGLNLTANYHFVFTLTHKRERCWRFDCCSFFRSTTTSLHNSWASYKQRMVFNIILNVKERERKKKSIKKPVWRVFEKCFLLFFSLDISLLFLFTLYCSTTFSFSCCLLSLILIFWNAGELFFLFLFFFYCWLIFCCIQLVKLMRLNKNKKLQKS
jgi:hypothetical protein